MSYRSIRNCLGLVAIALLQSGCAIFSAAPLFEIAKGAASAASTAVANYGTTKASNTMYHMHAPLEQVCIEFNRNAQVPDMVPSLQAELRNYKIESRVYEAGSVVQQCDVWLRYVATLEWDEPPFGNGYAPYLSAFALSLHTANGSLLASSSYHLEEQFSTGKWATTRKKVGPVVKALITGFES